MASLKREREIRHNEMTDLFREVERKSKTEWANLTPAEMLAHAQETLKIGASSVEYALHQFVTADPAMIKVKAEIKLLASRNEPVLITGPTGTGKELLAKALTIPGQPFVSENCAAIPEQLVESVFFGHRKGSFTGAHEDHVGLLEQAGEGIIFLDEIGDMALPLQAKFLRAIQENEIRRVGDVKTIKLGCRFVAATKYDLEERVNQGKFREDLYARLFTFCVNVTGLQSRPDDINVIAKSMVNNPDKFGKTPTFDEPDVMPPFPERTISMIYKYNVRGIKAALARYAAKGSYE